MSLTLQTGIRNLEHCSGIRDRLVEPLRRAVATWSTDTSTASDDLGALDLLSCSLDRVDEALQGLEG